VDLASRASCSSTLPVILNFYCQTDNGSDMTKANDELAPIANNPSSYNHQHVHKGYQEGGKPPFK
jgi:hypothetical protein